MTETRAPYLTPVDAEIVEALDTCAVPPQGLPESDRALLDLLTMDRMIRTHDRDTQRLMVAWLGRGCR